MRIAGQLVLTRGVEIEQDELIAMVRAMRHRDPDDEAMHEKRQRFCRSGRAEGGAIKILMAEGGVPVLIL